MTDSTGQTDRTGQDRRARLLADVAFGDDDMLFLRSDASFEQVCDASTLDEPAARRLADSVAHRFDWCARLGIPYFVLITPEKQVIYDDLLPDGCQVSPRRPALRLLDLVGPEVRPYLIYPETPLQQGRALEPTYFRTDSHWSRWGAYLGYRSLLDRLNEVFGRHGGLATLPPIAEHQVVMTPDQMIGDLGVRLEPEPLEVYKDIWPLAALRFRKRVLNRSFTNGQVEVWTHDITTLPRAVVFRSSNATHLLDPFLVSHFSRVVAVAGARTMLQDLVMAERPDCVITEIPERYLATPGGDGGIVALDFADFTAATGMTLPLQD
jgi:hypothetical protein